MIPSLMKTETVSVLGIALCLNLCGCSTTSETFDCKAGKGVGCKSISEVNQMIDQGTLGNLVERNMDLRSAVQHSQPELPLMAASLSTPLISKDYTTVERISLSQSIPFSNTLAVHRIQEEPLKVWIAPFQDAQGNFHEGSVIHTVIRPGHWHLKPLTQVNTTTRIYDSRVSDNSETNDPTDLDLEEEVE